MGSYADIKALVNRISSYLSSAVDGVYILYDCDLKLLRIQHDSDC